MNCPNGKFAESLNHNMWRCDPLLFLDRVNYSKVDDWLIHDDSWRFKEDEED